MNAKINSRIFQDFLSFSSLFLHGFIQHAQLSTQEDFGSTNIPHSLFSGFSEWRMNVIGVGNSKHKLSNEFERTKGRT